MYIMSMNTIGRFLYIYIYIYIYTFICYDSLVKAEAVLPEVVNESGENYNVKKE